MDTIRRDYKGYTIELTPQGNYCSAFAADIRDGHGKLLSHLGTAGQTEARAFARGQELIDFEEAYQQTDQ